MQREIEPEAIYSKTNNKEIIMQRENKWQDRFEKEFLYPFGDGTRSAVWSIDMEERARFFIQSEIDRAVAEERERLLAELEQTVKHTDPIEMKTFLYVDQIKKLINK